MNCMYSTKTYSRDKAVLYVRVFFHTLHRLWHSATQARQSGAQPQERRGELTSKKDLSQRPRRET